MRDPIPAVLGAVLSVTVAACGAQEPAAGPRTIPGAQPVEYGAIAWHRELDAALAAARAARQPVLMLFQEVPG